MTSPRRPRIPKSSRSSAPPRPRVVVVRKKSGGSGGGATAAIAILLAGAAFGLYTVAKRPSQAAPAQTAVVESASKGGTAATTEKAPAESGTGMTFIAPKPGEKNDQSFFGNETAGRGPGNGGSKDAEEAGAAIPGKKEKQVFDTSSTEGLMALEASGEMDRMEDLALTGIEATKTDAIKRSASVLEKAVATGAWSSYQDLLARSLAAGFSYFPAGEGRSQYDALWKEPHYYQAFLRWRFLDALDTSKIGYAEKKKSLVAWMLSDHAVMEEFLLTVKPQDNPQQVLDLLTGYREGNRENFAKYFNLALACSVVFDRTVSIPAASSAPDFPASVDPMKRFRWFVEKNEAGKLLVSIDKSPARDLVWVVCAPVPESELDWAISKMSLSRKGWGAAYGKIEYLMERAVNGLNPYESYTLAQILKEGGICGDQSYFCVNTARAHGIPAMTIAGETDLGGHAWAGVKVRDDEWSTTIGRIGGSANGKADNPQTGSPITEQEIWLWNDRAQQSQASVLKVFRHLWLADMLAAIDQVRKSEDAVRAANLTGKPFTETWTRLYDLLEKNTKRAENPASQEIVDAWVAFVADMRSEFRENPRMAELAATAESLYIFPNISQEEARKAMARERRRIERNSGEQKDLIATSLKREADLISERGGPAAFTDISNLYDKALKQYGGSITGFKAMAEDYFSFVGEDQTVARKAAREIELAFKRVVETGSKDWFRANTETDIYKMICGYYRKAGDESKAAQLEKRYQRLLRDAERGAL